MVKPWQIAWKYLEGGRNIRNPNLPALSWAHFPEKKKMEPRDNVLLGDSLVSPPPGSFPTQRLTMSCVTWETNPAGTQPSHMVRKPNLSG